MLRKDIREPRIQRRTPIAVAGDDNSMLWAVSYADVLMVLLCFFVLFYSSTSGQRDSVIRQILRAEGKSPASEPETKTASAPGVSIPLIAQLAKESKVSGITARTEQDSLIVELPRDIFGPSSNHLNQEGADHLKRVLSWLKPYQSQLELVFVGQTDPNLVTRKTPRVLNNMDLRFARAQAAFSMARGLGYDPSSLSLEVGGISPKGERSLSVRVQARGAPNDLPK